MSKNVQINPNISKFVYRINKNFKIQLNKNPSKSKKNLKITHLTKLLFKRKKTI